MAEMDENGLGHIEGFDESSELEVVEFTDDEGKTYTAAILAVLQVDDLDYAVLAPLDQLEDESGEDLELFLFEYGEDEDGSEFFGYIEDEEVFQRVQAAASAILDDSGEA